MRSQWPQMFLLNDFNFASLFFKTSIFPDSNSPTFPWHLRLYFSPDHFLPRGNTANVQPRSQGLSTYPGIEVVKRLAYVSCLPLEPVLQETSYLPERRTAEWLWCKLQVQTCHPTRCADSEKKIKQVYFWTCPHYLGAISRTKVQTLRPLAPPVLAACEIFCSCLTRSLKSATHWRTVKPFGTV